MYKLEEKMKKLLLTNVNFVLDGKVIKSGKVRVYNTKQFFIRFKLESDGDIKIYELPYPYDVKYVPNGFIFDYTLSAFCPTTELAYYKALMMDKSNSMKYHNQYLILSAF